MRAASGARVRIVERRDFPGLASLYLASFGGGRERLAEFVDTLEPGVPKAEKWVLMISTQFGCAVGCRMCDAGAMGFDGNLTAEQMLAQVVRVLEDNPALDARRHPKLKIHFARMGEPALNPAVLEALRRLPAELGGPVGLMPSLSTVAPDSPFVVPFFQELLRVKDELYAGGRFQLQFSLHALEEEQRGRVVPIRKWSLARIAEYGARFVRPGDRKITLNFALAPEQALDAEAAARAFCPTRFLIKITPVNPTETAISRGAAHVWMDAPDAVSGAADGLRARGFEVVVSPSLPEEIAAETSCGQLWSSALKDRAAVMQRNLERQAASYVSAGDLLAAAARWRERTRGYERRPRPPAPARAGLLVVDMQQLFLSPRSRAYLPGARAVLAQITRLIDAFRGAGRPVYFTRHVQAADAGLMPRWWKTACLEGSDESRLSPALRAPPEDTFTKGRYDPFTNPELEARLRRDGVEELVLAGVATNLCVESAARAAFDRGIQPFVVVDATAAHDEELHVGALRAMAFGVASLCDTDAVVSAARGVR